ncbi:MAG: hypothetical protein QOD12_1592 [Verrucomicrobiota bacterium]|jgi:hypothetical protein
MNTRDRDLLRLLRSAAGAPEAIPEAPFGFETRVVALWRAANGETNGNGDLTRFVRRIGVIAMAVLALASAGAYQQFVDYQQRSTPSTNEYAIADSAIQTEFQQ